MRTWPALLVVGTGVDHPDDLVQAALVDFDVAAIEETPDGARVFFASAGARAAAGAALQQRFPALRITPVDVPDDDWAARSQAALRAVRVGRIVVAPPWDVPPGAGGAEGLVIVIQPSMGFGTGHHATTRLCLAALQGLALDGRSVIDVGTGSGVLAIAASRLGASPVAGIDDDPDALQAARDNLGLNPAASASFEAIDLRKAVLPPADVVLANLTGGLLVAAAPALTRLVAAGGRLVLSGLMEEEETAVIEAFGGFRAAARAQEDEWVCLTLESRS